MKRVLFFFLFPLFLQAQETPDSTLTTYENRGGTFYAVTRNVFPSGRILTEEAPKEEKHIYVEKYDLGKDATFRKMITVAIAKKALLVFSNPDLLPFNSSEKQEAHKLCAKIIVEPENKKVLDAVTVLVLGVSDLKKESTFEEIDAVLEEVFVGVLQSFIISRTRL